MFTNGANYTYTPIGVQYGTPSAYLSGPICECCMPIAAQGEVLSGVGGDPHAEVELQISLRHENYMGTGRFQDIVGNQFIDFSQQ